MNAVAPPAVALRVGPRAAVRWLKPIHPPWGVWLGVVWAATMGAILAGEAIDKPFVAALPVVAFLGALLLIKAQVRTTLLVLMVCAFIMENPSERPPDGVKEIFYPLGTLLLSNLNNTIPIKALGFSGFDVLAAAMFALVAYRRATGVGDDPHPRLQTARPLVLALLLSMGSILFLLAFGVATGGSFNNSLWQCQKLFYVPLFAMLMSLVLRGPSDHATLGKVFVGSALFKAVLAIYARSVVGPEPAYVTSHADSMLFALAFSIPLARYLVSADRRSLKVCLLILPILAAGMVANSRRIVWVEVIAVVAIIMWLTPRTRLKRRVARALILALPLLPFYVAAGWNSTSIIFKPVATYRSMADSKSNRSTETRDVENYNLITTLKDHSIFGLGFGHEYTEYVKGDDISETFPQYRYIPHNSVLGLWTFTGVVGITGVWLFLAVTAFLAARSYRMARTVEDQTAALCCIGAVAIYLIQAYGDMGVVSWVGVLILAPAVVVAGKLAVATRAWPAHRRGAAAWPAVRPRLHPVGGTAS